MQMFIKKKKHTSPWFNSLRIYSMCLDIKVTYDTEDKAT